MLETINSVIAAISDVLYQPWFVPLFLIVSGIYFTFRCRFIQIRLFRDACKVIMEKPESEGSISSFGALMISTASRVGTGNIIGVSTAICLGGPGAIFWMWVTALLGGATAFIESTLAQIYKKRAPDGSCYGGPAYYMRDALGKRWMGVIFSVLIILIYAVGYNMLAAYNLQSTFSVFKFYHPVITPAFIGVILAFLFGVMVLGGAKRLASITEILVPFMGILYVLVSLLIIFLNIRNVPGMFASIFRNAFDFQSVMGGFSGSCIMYGVKRGLYSNEAGMGSAPNAAATASVSHPAKQGLVQMLSVFIDTILICSSTAFMILCTNLDASAYVDAAGNTMNAAYIQDSLVANFGPSGSVFITVALTLFAFTTLVGNYFYAEMNISYLYPKATKNKPFMLFYRLLAAVIIFMGAQFSAGLAWDLADVLMGIMALINVPSCLIMGKTACKALVDYRKQKSEGKNPVFHAADIGLSGTDYWIETE